MATITDARTAYSTSTSIPDGDTKEVNGTTSSTQTNASSKPRTIHQKYNHVAAVHFEPHHSCLSHEGQKPPSFAGFRNLMVLVIIVSNLRLILENYKKYGVLICVSCHDYRKQDVIYGLILYFSVPCHLFVAYMIELAAAQQTKGAVARTKKAEGDSKGQTQQQEHVVQHKTWRLIAFAHGVNATLNLIITTTVVYYCIHHPGIGTLCELHAVIVWLKTCSYAFTNRDLRHALLTDGPAALPMPDIYASCPYPRNITLSNLTYFWWAPTLIYQPVYPRTSRIRWSFVFKRFLEIVGLSVAIWIASAQYASPLLRNSLQDIANLNTAAILERLMKLSTISLFCWLAGFFALFQSFLNALAEIVCFADREFYADWWNAPSARKYWSMWNKPVYNFMKRHIYFPLVHRGCPPQLARVLVFVFSGFLHELLVGVPTHNILGRFLEFPTFFHTR